VTDAPVKKEDRASRRASIENGRLVRVSVTQIKAFRDCARKWWYDKRAHLPKKPPSKGQAIGDAGHKQIEHYLLTGEDVRGPLARSGSELLEPYVPHAPFQKGPLLVEAAITNPTLFTPKGVEFVGYSDLILPPDVIQAGQAIVIDHKFRKDLELYAETKEELRTDDQAIVYAAWCLMRWPSAKSVLFAHHNHQTQGPRLAFAVPVELDREHILDRFAEICSLVDGPMQEAAKRLVDLEVAAREDSCSKFGGCDFLSTCPNAPARRFAQTLIPGVPRPGITLKEDPNMGLVDAVRSAMKSTPAAAPATAPAVNSPPPVVAPATAPASAPPAASGGLVRLAVANAVSGKLYLLPSGGGLARLEALSPTGGFFSKPDGSPARVGLTEEVIDVTDDDTSRAHFGLPPLSPPASASAVSTPPAAPEKPARRMLIVDVPNAVAPPDQPPAAKNPEELAASAPPAAVSPNAAIAATGSNVPPPAAPEEPAKRGRGRPKGSKNASAAAEAIATGEASASLFNGLVLCVDCAPSVGATDLTPYVADLAENLAKSANVPDVRFAPKDNPLAFMAWRGALAAAARESPPSGLCSIYSSDLAEPVIEALSGLASLVIRGRR
jgi:hypothetical protein